MHYGLLSQSTLEIKEAVHYETMELVGRLAARFFLLSICASGGGVHFLIVLYPSMQLSMHGEETFWNGRREIKARASHFVTPNSFSF